MPIYESPGGGGAYRTDVPARAEPASDRYDARLRPTSVASRERNACAV